ncbi:MAG: hypothetical protein PWP64_1037 [Candidatus Cloacimonadota bacterium]|nr:hypothetical protein [Candidatus Cloacimonadota bacterium]
MGEQSRLVGLHYANIGHGMREIQICVLDLREPQNAKTPILPAWHCSTITPRRRNAQAILLAELYHLAIFLLPFWVKMAGYDEGLYFVTSCITA